MKINLNQRISYISITIRLDINLITKITYSDNNGHQSCRGKFMKAIAVFPIIYLSWNENYRKKKAFK